MTTSSNNSTEQQRATGASGRSRCKRSGDANWSGINIAAMVAGFMLFWPIGLFMLFWILIGRDAKAIPATIRQLWSKVTGFWEGHDGPQAHDSTENVVFNEFQQTQYERIREIKDELKERARRFRDFRANSRRRADEEEFNQFMSDAPVRNGE